MFFDTKSSKNFNGNKKINNTRQFSKLNLLAFIFRFYYFGFAVKMCQKLHEYKLQNFYGGRKRIVFKVTYISAFIYCMCMRIDLHNKKFCTFVYARGGKR